MSAINYLNLDEGRPVSSSLDEFSKSAIYNMTAWLLDALESEGFVPLPAPLNEYHALVDKGDEGLVCSVYGPAKILPAGIREKAGEEMPEGVPLFIFGVALENGQRLWDFFMQGFYIGDRILTMPTEPWVIVIPYEMYPCIPDPAELVRFQKCVARSWADAYEK